MTSKIYQFDVNFLIPKVSSFANIVSAEHIKASFFFKIKTFYNNIPNEQLRIPFDQPNIFIMDLMYHTQ